MFILEGIHAQKAFGIRLATPARDPHDCFFSHVQVQHPLRTVQKAVGSAGHRRFGMRQKHQDWDSPGQIGRESKPAQGTALEQPRAARWMRGMICWAVRLPSPSKEPPGPPTHTGRFGGVEKGVVRCTGTQLVFGGHLDVKFPRADFCDALRRAGL